MNDRTQNALLIRADASVATGTGHVMRCVAIAQAWQDASGKAVFATCESTAAVDDRLGEERVGVRKLDASPGSQHDAHNLVQAARAEGAEWVVVDGYYFGPDYCRTLFENGLKFLVVDDRNSGGHMYADFVLNPDAWDAAEILGSREAHTRLLLGPSYALLRREFASWDFEPNSCLSDRNRLLVTMGGSDPENLSLRLTEALSDADLQDFELTVLVGGSNPHFSSLEKAKEASTAKFTLVRDPNDVPRWMAGADVAVTVAGNSVWELLFMGCAVLCCSRTTADERFIARLEEQGCLIDLGPAANAGLEKKVMRALAAVQEPGVRQTMRRNGRALVDGRGANRVVEALQATTADRGSPLRRQEASR